MDLGIQNRVALVAGSSSGLGKATAFALAREGARLALCARNKSVLECTAGKIRRDTGAEVMASPVDVTVHEEVQKFVAHAADQYGRLDICVANAGGPPPKSFAETTLEDWQTAAGLNLMSTVYFAKEVLPIMQQQGWGRFIAITSVAAKQPLEGLILSNSVRAGVSGLMKTLASEYGRSGVLVNTVCPGYTATSRLVEVSGRLAAREGIPVAEVEQRWSNQTALGRLGKPEEIADLIVFLASERAGYITGTSIAVDGGLIRGLY